MRFGRSAVGGEQPVGPAVELVGRRRRRNRRHDLEAERDGLFQQAGRRGLVERDDVEAGVVERLGRRAGVADDEREERLAVHEELVAVQLHGVGPAVGDRPAGCRGRGDRVGRPLHVIDRADFEVVDPDLRRALAAPDVEHQAVDVGVGADHVALLVGPQELQLLAQPLHGLLQRQLLPTAGDLVLVGLDEHRERLVEVLRVVFLRQDDAAEELHAGPVGLDPEADVELVVERRFADVVGVVDVVAGLGIQLDVLGASAAVGELVGDAVGGFLVSGVGGPGRPERGREPSKPCWSVCWPRATPSSSAAPSPAASAAAVHVKRFIVTAPKAHDRPRRAETGRLSSRRRIGGQGQYSGRIASPRFVQLSGRRLLPHPRKLSGRKTENGGAVFFDRNRSRLDAPLPPRCISFS